VSETTSIVILFFLLLVIIAALDALVAILDWLLLFSLFFSRRCW
jgi:hypothetical protein